MKVKGKNTSLVVADQTVQEQTLWVQCNMCGWERAVGIVTCYGLDSPGLKPQKGKHFLDPFSLLYTG